MAKQSKDVYAIPDLNPVSLAAQAAQQEAKENIEKSQPEKEKTIVKTAKQSRGEVPMVATLVNVNKECRVCRTFTISTTNDNNLTLAAARLKMSKSAILEQLFETWWKEYNK